MVSFRVRTKVESDTLVLPELKTLIGKMVEIEVTEQPEFSRRTSGRKRPGPSVTLPTMTLTPGPTNGHSTRRCDSHPGCLYKSGTLGGIFSFS